MDTAVEPLCDVTITIQIPSENLKDNYINCQQVVKITTAMSKQNRNDISPVKQLGLFVRMAKQLRRRSCFDFLSTYRSSVTMSWKQGSEIQISNLAKPDEEAFRSYLIDFRQFLLSESPVQVNKILNMAVNRARHITFREELIKLQADWKAINKRLLGIRRETESGTVLLYSGHELFLLWLNGTIFHPDVDAEELFSSLGELLDVTEVGYAKHVGLCSNFIVHLAAAVESGLNTNGFDLLNEFAPHTRPKFVFNVADEDRKAAVIRFWKWTKRFPQTLSVCEEHDQDTVIVVDGLDEGSPDLQGVKVELRSCCDSAVDRALAVIEFCLAYVDNAERHGPPSPKEPIEILEVEVRDRADIQVIKAALADYRLIWRRKVGRMRCAVHSMPPGARGFGVDLYHRGVGEESDSVFLQGCCTSFMEQVLDKLRQNV